MTNPSNHSSLHAQVSERQNVDYNEVAHHIRAEGLRKYVAGFDRVVFTNGCFDLLHAGHLATLRHAFELAGRTGAVVVGLNTDDSVRRLKGPSRPILDETSRGQLLASLKYVDFVVTFDEDTPLELIKALRPDVIVKGGDYIAAKHEVVGGELGIHVELAPYSLNMSTSNIIRKIKGLP